MRREGCAHQQRVALGEFDEMGHDLRALLQWRRIIPAPRAGIGRHGCRILAADHLHSRSHDGFPDATDRAAGDARLIAHHGFCRRSGRACGDRPRARCHPGRIKGLEKEIANAAAAKPTAGKALKQAEQVEADARNALQGIRRQIADGAGPREGATRRDGPCGCGARESSRGARVAAAARVRDGARGVAAPCADPAGPRRAVPPRGLLRLHHPPAQHACCSRCSRKSSRWKPRRPSSAISSRRSPISASARKRACASCPQPGLSGLAQWTPSTSDLGTRQQKLTRLRRDARSLTDLMERLERESRASARQAEPMPEPGPAQQLQDLPLRGRMVAPLRPAARGGIVALGRPDAGGAGGYGRSGPCAAAASCTPTGCRAWVCCSWSITARDT